MIIFRPRQNGQTLVLAFNIHLVILQKNKWIKKNVGVDIKCRDSKVLGQVA